MKAKWLALMFLLLSVVVAQQPAQQSEPDRKLLADIRARAEEGDALFQSALGSVFDQGSLGVARDEAEAVKWYRKAAQQNWATAQSNLGYCYSKGEGVTKDEVEAVKWYRKAAEQNWATAQYNLGVCYEDGSGVAKDAVEAVKWYRKAAEQNYASAQFTLGVCYSKGRGVTKDLVEAVKWYGKAAEQNNANAQFNFGLCYAKGAGFRPRSRGPVSASPSSTRSRTSGQ